MRWCDRHVAPRHSGFELTLADVENRNCSPDGRSAASRLRFPYEPSRSLYARYGLQFLQPIQHGSWAAGVRGGRQDVIWRVAPAN